jgi:hypothetical protein
MGRFLGSLGVLVLSAAAFAQSVTVSQSAPNNQNLTPEQQAAVVRLSNLQRNFGKSSMNSPGVALSLKEISRKRAADRTLVTYELYASGLPKDFSTVTQSLQSAAFGDRYGRTALRLRDTTAEAAEHSRSYGLLSATLGFWLCQKGVKLSGVFV